MTDNKSPSPDNRARAQPHSEDVDQSDTAQGTGKTEKGNLDAERGERMETGKSIARGGKSSGNVPGATPAPTEKETND